MKIYVAASFPRQEEAKTLAQLLRNLGHQITSRWLHQKEVYAVGAHPDEGLSDEKKVEIAERDLADLVAADRMVVLSGDTLSRGGRHTELGFALGHGLPVDVIGTPDNVFMFFRTVALHRDTDAYLAAMVAVS